MSEHHPDLYASRHGCWSHCACRRWKSRLYTTVTGAHLAFGQHLLAEATQRAALAAGLTHHGEHA